MSHSDQNNSIEMQVGWTIDVVKRQAEKVLRKRRSDMNRFNSVIKYANIPAWLPVVLPLVALLFAPNALGIVLAVSALISSFLLIVLILFLWRWISESQFFIYEVEVAQKEAELSEKDAHGHDKTGKTDATESHDSIMSKHDWQKRAKNCVVKQGKAYWPLPVGVFAGALFLAESAGYFFRGHALIGMSTLVLGFSFFFVFLSLFYLHKEIVSPVSTPVPMRELGDGLGDGLVVLPKKAYVGDSHNISVAFASDEISEAKLTKFLTQKTVDDYFLTELQAAGIDVDGNRKVRFSSIGAGAIWNCHFPKVGNFTINLTLSKVFPKRKLQVALFTQEHTLSVLNRFHIFWQATLGTILLTASTIVSLITVASFVVRLSI